jgi:hypothetical protein
MIVYKCEGGFYSVSQIWGLRVLLALELTIIFNIYIVPTEAILRIFHCINFFKLGDFIVWVKKKSQEENRFKSLFKLFKLKRIINIIKKSFF